MSTLKEVEAADKRLQKAQVAFRSQVENGAAQGNEQSRKLAKALRDATDEYLRLVLELKRGRAK